MFRSVLIALTAATLLSAAGFAGTAEAAPGKNREFNIGMPPAVSAFGVEREMKESGEKSGSEQRARDVSGDGKPDIITAPGPGPAKFGVEREMKESGEK